MTCRSATRCSATAPTTGSPSGFATGCTPGRATPSGTPRRGTATTSPNCCRSTTSTPSVRRRRGPTRSMRPSGPGGSTPTWRRRSTSSVRSPPPADCRSWRRRSVAGTHEGLGDARNLTGNYAGAASAYRSARRLIGDDGVAQARLLLKLARVEGWLDRFTNALRWITRGIGILKDIDTPDAAPSAGRALRVVRAVLPGGREAPPGHQVVHAGGRAGGGGRGQRDDGGRAADHRLGEDGPGPAGGSRSTGRRPSNSSRRSGTCPARPAC